MSQRHLLNQVQKIERRQRLSKLFHRLSYVWVIASCLIVGLFVVEHFLRISLATPWLLFSIIAMLLLRIVIDLNPTTIERRQTALDLEQQFPDLDSRLLAALDLQPNLQTGKFRFLQQRLLNEVAEHSEGQNWNQIAPVRKTYSLCGLQFLFLAAFVWMYQLCASVPSAVELNLIFPFHEMTSTEIPLNFGLTVEPGNTEIERGTSLLVLARFSETLPDEVSLVSTGLDGKELTQLLSKSLDDPIFGGRISSIKNSLTYHIAYAEKKSDQYTVTVFDYPELVQSDVTIHYPKYTKLSDSEVKEISQVSAVEGSEIIWTCTLNKPVAKAQMVAEDGTTYPLTADTKNPTIYHCKLQPKKNTRLNLELVDEADRKNKDRWEFVIDVLPNRRPELKLAFPKQDMRVSPLEEVALEANAWDDFGLEQFGVILTMAGKKPQTIILGEKEQGQTTKPMTHLISFEELKAQPDQLLSYYVFADDLGPDGEPRRTFSDMQFAEVRHFEEIFRQGQQPPGGASKKSGGSPNAKQAEKLGELQKQIINATWTIIRRENAAEISDKFTADVTVIADSQASALKLLDELKKKVKDPKSKVFVDEAGIAMQTALDELTLAHSESSAAALITALTAEQSAYQSLLRLRAREHNVVKGQKSGGGKSGGSSRSQQQLQQLELTKKENRYENQKQAQQKGATSANREQLQVLNRLKELSRRQNDINQKLKDIENELRQAKSEQEKQEIRRRLKRLREEQQDLLKDVDELRQRMDRPENQSEMTKNRQQLDQTRKKIQQSTEALKKGQVSKALNAGTKAQRELDKLKEEFRKKSAGQFDQAMKEMKRQADELSEKQQELATKIADAPKEKRPSLRSPGKPQKLEEEFESQKNKLNDILDQMKNVIQTAEQSEPLLSRQLYETVRKTRKHKPSEALDLTSQLLRRGFKQAAQETQELANKGIDELKKGIDQAAQSVLGNELDSLKRAKNELADLKKTIEQELAQATPQSKNHPDSSPSKNQKPAAGAPQNSAKKLQGQPKSSPIQQVSQSKPANKPNSQNKPSHKPGQSKSQQPGKSSKPGKSSSGKPTPGSSSPGGSHPGNSKSQQPSPAKGSKPSSNSKPSFLTSGGQKGGPGGQGGPITGNNFQQWSDQVRDIEEMLENPKLKADVAKIRERAKSMRAEFKRHSKVPNAELLNDQILKPMIELENRLREEIAKRESKDSLVPLDRDPVPKQFEDLVRRYYERLGSGK